MRRTGLVAAAIVAVIALMWIGSEMHYRNCVNAAVASTPPPQRQPTASVEQDIENVLNGKPAIAAVETSRAQAVDACSRVPF